MKYGSNFKTLKSEDLRSVIKKRDFQTSELRSRSKKNKKHNNNNNNNNNNRFILKLLPQYLFALKNVQLPYLINNR